MLFIWYLLNCSVSKCCYNQNSISYRRDITIFLYKTIVIFFVFTYQHLQWSKNIHIYICYEFFLEKLAELIMAAIWFNYSHVDCHIYLIWCCRKVQWSLHQDIWMGINMVVKSAMKGYKMILIMPSHTSLERRVTMTMTTWSWTNPN